MRGEFNMNDIFVYPLQNSKEYKDLLKNKIKKIYITKSKKLFKSSLLKKTKNTKDK